MDLSGRKWVSLERRAGRQLATTMRRSPIGLERQLPPEPAIRLSRSRL